MRKYRLTAVLAVLAVLASSAADLVAPQVLRVIVDSGIRAGDIPVIFRGALVLVAVTSDVDLVRDFVGGGLVSAVSAVLLLVGAVVALLVMDWRLALVSLAVVPATLFVLTRFVASLWPMFRRSQEILGRLNSVLALGGTFARLHAAQFGA